MVPRVGGRGPILSGPPHFLGWRSFLNNNMPTVIVLNFRTPEIFEHPIYFWHTHFLAHTPSMQNWSNFPSCCINPQQHTAGSFFTKQDNKTQKYLLFDKLNNNTVTLHGIITNNQIHLHNNRQNLQLFKIDHMLKYFVHLDTRQLQIKAQ